MNNASSETGRAGLPAHERVYREIRDQVLFGALAPGEPVTIQGLVERLGAGMTPVREALRRLTAEGALHALGNRRIVVPELTAQHIEELTEARLALEPRLAYRAAQRVDAKTIAMLRSIDRALDDAIARGDVSGYLSANHQFHTSLNAVAEAPIITALVEGLWLRFGPSMRVICGQVGTRNLPDRHKDLLDAFETRDLEAAQEAMRADVEQGMALIARSAAPVTGSTV
ncbi:GntR family transcriptional regulator [Cognatishimia sp. F0-27]|uniref:GntR family transcriptional regulator n=1 Tax=Cognatishimia sp. F0-27 TaxID=2816855 RepID=UPI001D0C2867|nr:GntR family transcriptional regulator [Cognatishimia sp. F0-27]MCC1493016.1 GntR family transcriptional regulator [Cognatishimia sp. F0-27]